MKNIMSNKRKKNQKKEAAMNLKTKGKPRIGVAAPLRGE